MKIAMPVNENIRDTEIGNNYARVPYFLIYDSESQEIEFIKNSAALARGGAGVKAAQLVIDNKIDVLITPQLGLNAAGPLKMAEIKIYKARRGLAKDNIEAYLSGDLDILEEIHSGFHGGN